MHTLGKVGLTGAVVWAGVDAAEDVAGGWTCRDGGATPAVGGGGGGTLAPLWLLSRPTIGRAKLPKLDTGVIGRPVRSFNMPIGICGWGGSWDRDP